MTSCNTRPPPESGPAGSEPTARQLQVLAYVHSHREARGYAPTLRDICKRFGFVSTNGANDFLERLEERRLLVRTPNVARSLRPTESGKAAAEAWLREHPEEASHV